MGAQAEKMKFLRLSLPSDWVSVLSVLSLLEALGNLEQLGYRMIQITALNINTNVLKLKLKA